LPLANNNVEVTLRRWYIVIIANLTILNILEIAQNKSSLNTKRYEKGITMNT